MLHILKVRVRMNTHLISIKNGKEASDNDDNAHDNYSDSEDSSDGPSRHQRDKGQFKRNTILINHNRTLLNFFIG